MPVITGDIELDSDASIIWAPEDEDRGPFNISVDDAGGGADPAMYSGYNVSLPGAQLINPDDRGLIWGIESDYDDGSGHNKMESYIQYQHASGLGIGTYTRSLMTQHDKVTGLPTVLFLSSGPPNGISFCYNDGTGTTEQQTAVGKQKMQMVDNRFTIYAVPDGGNPVLNIDSTAGTPESGLSISSRSRTNGVHIDAMSPAANELIYMDAKGTSPIVLNSNNGGSVLFPNGTLSNPGIGFTGDQNSGFQSVGADIVGIVVGAKLGFQVDGSTASSATGVKVKTAAAGGRIAISATSSGTNEGMDIDAKGSGTIRLGANSTGDILLSRKLQGKNAALSYAVVGNGLTMTNTTDMTGTGNPDWTMNEQGTAASTWYFAAFRSAAGADNEFLFRGDGTALCDGSWNGGGADYAEYFEWEDGNPKKEDRRGLSVVVTAEGKIKPAKNVKDKHKIIGVVSARAAFVGDAAEMRWKGKYLRDEYGAEIEEIVTMVSWTEHVDGTPVEKRCFADRLDNGEQPPVIGSTRTPTARRKLNPDFDPNREYIPRSRRSEWAPVGLMGKLVLRKGQQTGDRWIKLKNIGDDFESWLIR